MIGWLLIVLLVAAGVYILAMHFKEERARNRTAVKEPTPSQKPGTAAFNLGFGVMTLGPLLYFFTVGALGLGGLRVGQLIGIGMLVCSAICVMKIGSIPEVNGKRPGSTALLLVSLAVGLMGLIAVLLGSGRAGIYH